MQGQPVFDSEESCSYKMYWTTTAACRIDDRLATGCLLVNKVTEDEFDLTGLDASTEHAGVTYRISACTPISCGGDDKAFGCQTTSTGSFSLGQSGGMELLDNRPLLKLTGGQACHNDVYHRSAFVNFVCSVSSNLLSNLLSWVELTNACCLTDGRNRGACLHLRGYVRVHLLPDMDHSQGLPHCHCQCPVPGQVQRLGP